MSAFDSDWSSFVEGELKLSNEVNNKALGGGPQQKNVPTEEDETGIDSDVGKIFEKFANFNGFSNAYFIIN